MKKSTIPVFIIPIISFIILIPIASILAISLFTPENNKITASMTKKINSNDIQFFKDKIIITKNSIHLGILPDTGSMLPTLPSNSTIIWLTDFDKVEIGDIVMAKSSDGRCNVTHRILQIKNNDYILKGDNNLIQDPCIYKRENIYALIIGVIY